MTLSRYWIGEGKRNLSSHGALEASHKILQPIKDELRQLVNVYYPIEVDHSLDLETKIPKMVEWWQRSHDLIASARLTKSDLRSLASSSDLTFRTATRDFVELLHGKNIPLLVFSAGVYDVIFFILEHHGLKLSNVHLISNRMLYSHSYEPVGASELVYGTHYLEKVDDDATCVAFSEPIIHVYNKSEAALSPENTAYFDDLKSRTNVLLFGDSIGDLDMAKGSKHSVLLSVGFLNHSEDALLARYEEAFDIVILNDVGFEFALRLLDGI